MRGIAFRMGLSFSLMAFGCAEHSGDADTLSEAGTGTGSESATSTSAGDSFDTPSGALTSPSAPGSSSPQSNPLGTTDATSSGGPVARPTTATPASGPTVEPQPMSEPSDGSGGVAGGGASGSGASGYGGANEGGRGGTAGSGAATGGAGSSASGEAGESSTGGVAGSNDTPAVDQDNLEEITLHLAGDSTVMTYDAGSAQEGWGQELGQFFIDKVRINNQAIGGASIRTFQTGRWTNIMSALNAGDYVMIQFGTNDSGSVAGRHVDVPDFMVALNEMVDDVEGKQATAIFVTPSALQEWSGGMEGNSRLGPYADAMREVGPTRDVLVVDLNARSVEYLNVIGQSAAEEIYIGGDKAHFTKAGATQMAEFVASELRRIESPLSAYLTL